MHKHVGHWPSDVGLMSRNIPHPVQDTARPTMNAVDVPLLDLRQVYLACGGKSLIHVAVQYGHTRGVISNAGGREKEKVPEP